MPATKRKPATFADRLTALREARGLSKLKLSRRAGISPSVIGRLESGGAQGGTQGSRGGRPSFDVACKLADALGCSLDDFR